MNFNLINRLDKTLLLSIILLIAIGLIVILSTSYSSVGVDFSSFTKQLYFSIFGIILMILASSIDYKSLKNYTGILYVFACFILFTVLFFGLSIRGSSSWFDFGFFNFQPSEFVKIVIIIVMAKYLAKENSSSRSIRKLFICKSLLLEQFARLLL